MHSNAVCNMLNPRVICVVWDRWTVKEGWRGGRQGGRGYCSSAIRLRCMLMLVGEESSLKTWSRDVMSAGLAVLCRVLQHQRHHQHVYIHNLLVAFEA